MNSLIPVMWKGKQHPLWPWLPPRGIPNIPLNVPLALRQCPVSEGKAHMLPPHQPKLSPSVACHTGVNLWVIALPITKHPRHGTANKDRVGWTGQREGLDSYHRTVGICEKERNTGRLWKERTWGWLKISLTYFTTLLNLQLWDLEQEP